MYQSQQGIKSRPKSKEQLRDKMSTSFLTSAVITKEMIFKSVFFMEVILLLKAKESRYDQAGDVAVQHPMVLSRTILSSRQHNKTSKIK
jgi:hypothetical protein